MNYNPQTYIIFDRKNDTWAYNRIKKWKSEKYFNFDIKDTQEVYQTWVKTKNERNLKCNLRKLFQEAEQIIVLIGEKTKNLNTYMKCEIETALEIDVPIIGVNLNGKRCIDYCLCPSIMSNKYIIFIPFNKKIIQCALEHFPSEHKSRPFQNNGPRLYNDLVYHHLGLQYE